MLGVDVVDQLIAYYQPKIRCRRTWMPIFLHCLDILLVLVNSYILCKETAKEHSDVDDSYIWNHKQFWLNLSTLIGRGNSNSNDDVIVHVLLHTNTCETLRHVEPVLSN